MTFIQTACQLLGLRHAFHERIALPHQAHHHGIEFFDRNGEFWLALAGIGLDDLALLGRSYGRGGRCRLPPEFHRLIPFILICLQIGTICIDLGLFSRKLGPSFLTVIDLGLKSSPPGGQCYFLLAQGFSFGAHGVEFAPSSDDGAFSLSEIHLNGGNGAIQLLKFCPLVAETRSDGVRFSGKRIGCARWIGCKPVNLDLAILFSSRNSTLISALPVLLAD